MALLDFLGSGMGGNTPVNQNTMVAGTAGQPVGPTWGSALQAGMKYGSSPGSSAPRLANTVPTAPTGTMPPASTPPIQSLQPVATPKTVPEMQKEQGGDDSLGMILSALLKVIGL
jgi:hypothetical protein